MEETNENKVIVLGRKTAGANYILVQSTTLIKSAIKAGKTVYVKYTSNEDDTNPNKECFMLVLGISSIGPFGMNEFGSIYIMSTSPF